MSFVLFADLPLADDRGFEVPEEVRWARYVNACQALASGARSTGASPGEVAHVLSEELVGRIFGEGWLDGLLAEGRAWKSTGDADTKRAYLLEVVQLGRYLFDLQSFDFYDNLITDLRERNDLRAVMFEAEVAWLLGFLPLRSGLRVRSGVKGNDYDLGVQLDGGTEWAIEAKAKEDVDYSRGALRNPLKKAAPQLPAGGIGSVFFRAPAYWLHDAAFVNDHESVIDEVLRSNSRIHAIVLVADTWDTDLAERFQTPKLHIDVHLRDGVDERVSRFLNAYQKLWSIPPGPIHPIWSGVI